jgi:hypothetical protein
VADPNKYPYPLPDAGQQVEIFVDGKWVKATFFPADYWPTSDGDELWCMHYFSLDDGGTIPPDVHDDINLPEWRPLSADLVTS